MYKKYRTLRKVKTAKGQTMICKKCPKTVEPQYENSGICENCSADGWGHIINIYKGERGLTTEDLAEDPLDVAISDLELPTQISNRLFALRIIDLGDLVKWSEKQLLNGRGLGEATIKKLKAKLLFYGLALTQDPSL